MSVAVSGFLGISSLQARPQNWNVKPKRLTDSPFSIGTWNCPEAILTSGQLMEGGTSALEAVVKGVALKKPTKKIPPWALGPPLTNRAVLLWMPV